MTEKKTGFLKQLGIALFRPDLYGRLMEIRAGKIVLFVMVFAALVMTLRWTDLYNIVFWADNSICQHIREESPDFYIENGNLFLEEKYTWEQDGIFVCIDTEIEQYDLNDLQFIIDKGHYNQVMLISKTNIVTLQSSNEINQLSFSQFDLKEKVTRDDLLDIAAEFANDYFLPGLLILTVLDMVGMAIMGLLLRFVAAIIAFIFQKSIPSGQLYRIGIHAYAIQMVVPLLISALPYGLIPSGVTKLIRFVLLIVYLILAVLSVDAYNEEKRKLNRGTAFGGINSFQTANTMDTFDTMNHFQPTASEPSGTMNHFQPTASDPSGIVNGSQSDFSAVTNCDTASQPAAPETILIQGVSYSKKDLDLVNNYLSVGLKENALSLLCDVLNCTREDAEEVLNHWEIYYGL